MKLKLTAFLFIGVTLMSCSKHIVGTWNIQKYETTTAAKQGIALTNIGTMTFKKNGSGEKNISYTIFETKKEDKSSFKWTQSENYITIESDGSEFSKTWIVVKDENKFQKWQSTDGNNQVQVLELVK